MMEDTTDTLKLTGTDIEIAAKDTSIARHMLGKCCHKRVEIDDLAMTLVCQKCGVQINPVIWIRDYMRDLDRERNQSRRIIESRSKSQKELNKVNNRDWKYDDKSKRYNRPAVKYKSLWERAIEDLGDYKRRTEFYKNLVERAVDDLKTAGWSDQAEYYEYNLEISEQASKLYLNNNTSPSCG